LPPLKAASLVSRRILPFCFSGPWHLTQVWLRIGWMSFAKSTLLSAAREPAALHAAAVTRMRSFFIVGSFLKDGASVKVIYDAVPRSFYCIGS